jgi:hypothetical protein
VSARTTAEDLVRILGRISGGTLRASMDGAPFLDLDAEHRTVTLEVDPWVDGAGGGRALVREGHVSLWQSRGIPGALARSGWTVSLRSGPHELVRLGHDASAWTGHVHVTAAALGKLRRLV